MPFAVLVDSVPFLGRCRSGHHAMGSSVRGSALALTPPLHSSVTAWLVQFCSTAAGSTVRRKQGTSCARMPQPI